MRVLRMTGLLVASLFVCLSLVFLPEKLVFDGGYSYTFYVGDGSKNCKVVTVTENAALTKMSLKGVCGEAATYRRLDVRKFIADLGGTVEFTEELEDSFSYFCSAPLPYSQTLNGTEINLQVCVREDRVIAASPVIYGGY